MKKEKFIGDYEVISPEKLIKKGSESGFDQFFLVLALAYNNLKDLLLLSVDIGKKYESPIAARTFHDGQITGIVNHINILIASTVCEFISYLSKRDVQKVIESKDFKRVLNRIGNPKYRKDWEELIAVALEKNVRSDEFTRILKEIRNNVGFHFNYENKKLLEGYKNFFFTSSVHSGNENAVYAIGETMETTRFFYADAAIQQFIDDATKESSISTKDYNRALGKTVGIMNKSISALVSQYIEEKNSEKH